MQFLKKFKLIPFECKSENLHDIFTKFFGSCIAFISMKLYN